MVMRINKHITVNVLFTVLLTMTGSAAMNAKNILGTELVICGVDPKTGFFRDGYCNTNADDHGTHVVCAEVTETFLEYTKAQGNDLSTPNPLYRFPGLKPGDKWCLCALRWQEALNAGAAPMIIPESTHEKALQLVKKDDLLAHSIHNDR